MSNSPCPSPQHSMSAAGLVWLISFGDLLTLLVCFFLVLTPWSATYRRSLQSQQQVNPARDSKSIPGTALASRSVGPSASREHVLIAREYVLTKLLVSDEQRKALRDLLHAVKRDTEELHMERARVLLEVCGEANRMRVLQSVGTELSDTFGALLDLEIEIESQCQTIQTRHSKIDDLVGSIALVQG